MDIGTLIGGTGARLVDPSAATTRVCDVTDDSRSVMPGSLFIARPGTASDGRDHIAQALRAGASITRPHQRVQGEADALGKMITFHRAARTGAQGIEGPAR